MEFTVDLPRKSCNFERELLRKPTHHLSCLIVAKDRSTSPTWVDVKAFLLTFDRAGLQGLVQDLMQRTRTIKHSCMHGPKDPPAQKRPFL